MKTRRYEQNGEREGNQPVVMKLKEASMTRSVRILRKEFTKRK